MKFLRRLRLSPVDRASGAPTVLWWMGLVLFSVSLFAVAVPTSASLYHVPIALAFLHGAVQCGALILAPIRPVAATVMFVVSVWLFPVIGTRSPDIRWPWPWPVTSMIAFALLVGLLTFYRDWRYGVWAFVLSIAASATPIIGGGFTTTHMDATVINIIIATSIAGAVFLLGVVGAQRERIRAQLIKEREITAAEQSRRLLMEERNRIARELHDVVAHSMSIIQVQASTARYRLPEINEAAASEFEDIAASARSSMTEMRRLLGVLRSENEEAELAPQQGLADIGGLVEAARRAGVAVDLVQHELPGQIPASVQIAAFRITQEAISNAVRHAPGAPIDVRITAAGNSVDVRVANSASETPVPASARGTGHGLVGMRERAALLDGSVETSADGNGGYIVHARLPVPPADATPSDHKETT